MADLLQRATDLQVNFNKAESAPCVYHLIAHQEQINVVYVLQSLQDERRWLASEHSYNAF